MPNIFLDGQQNLAALSVPGVYGDIILPSPFLLGTPTNIEGLVGVGSWGPLNSIIPVSKPIDCSIQLGDPKIRNADIATYVAAATQVGGAIGFFCVRVSDGTDVAASAAIGTGGTFASATVTFSGQPSVADSVTFNGTAYTFASANIGSTLAKTLQIMIAELVNSNDVQLVKFTYSLNAATNVITVTAATVGTGGNALTLTKSGANIAVTGGGTLTGGAAGGGTGITFTGKFSGIRGNQINISFQTGSLANSFMAIISFPGLPPEQFNNITGAANAFWVNLANAINLGNAYHGPSAYVVATAGASTAAPTLGVVTPLTGGTDGDTGVTDAMLVGQDTVPRKGMYVLRSANVDCFTLCDFATTTSYALIAAFALQETALAVFGSPQGDTIANALATRISAGVDTPWFWYILGDWPSFADAFNGVSRQINPSAFGVGICGNLSPQQSPLNKALQGINSTQRTTLGLTYSDTELTQINNGGIDVILGPLTSPGGYYYSFATGRNASSNTAANGVEYTRMTNFLIRTAQSKAAGSFIGRLQSIQPDDQTRSDAKALFDGLSAQLASSEVGLGIGGQGMIDKPWLVQCDLTNNPPDLQARGYLFLYWQVRYLNVVRYFVIKFQGGGNVTVNVQNTVPSASQFQPLANAA